ncbi:PAS domain S-box protein [Azohydromonas caseinilytica]|uniref:histidine kinase n=1 Tax=Azohydromonas caseinilytica TaxID=2728836 RepID=A0A848FBV1_9BURK|nr:PAS domain S-box protein [Azohydromonas caseinilytica]NML15670.1 PAS domain S-box protein [Azohydromonas caseinilytica]
MIDDSSVDSPHGDMQSLLAAIVASSDDAILSTTLDGVITSWNGGAERMYGHTAAQALGRPLALIVPDDRAEEALQLLQRVARGERVAHHETVRLTRDGRRLDVLLGVSPVRDARGRIVGASKVARDISAEKAAQAQRRQAEERLRLITDNVPALISYVDRDLRYRFVNRGYERWFGREREQLIGCSVAEVLGEAAWRSLGPRIARVLAGESVHFEGELDLKGAGRRCVEVSYVPHRGPDGRVEGMAVMAQDVSARRQAEQALRESREVLGLAMRAGRMGAWSRHLDSGEVWWSQELEELFGLDVGSFNGNEQAFLDLVHPDDRQTVRQAVRQGIESVSDYVVEFRFRHASGRWGWMEGRGRAVDDGNGRAAMLYGLGIDITERKRAEQELQRLNAELQHEARRKDEFLATLAHELRNPLAPMRHALEIQRLRLPAGDAQLQWTHELLQRQLRQLTRLVDDLLEISRITQGRLELRREPLALAEVVQAAVEAARPLLQARRHAFAQFLPGEPLRLVGDPARLTQALLNLLNNAAQYTPEGGRIELRVRREGDEAVISVRDNGIGLAPEHLSQVFDMFSQVQPALQRTHGGLGVGLALVRALAGLHGGSVRARSDGPGHGSEFELRLPLPAQPPEAKAEPVSPPASVAPARRVMVVDDNADAAESLALLLELQGHEVRTAHDGPGAVALACEYRPELAIVDIGLPGFSGYEVARRIRAQDGGSALLLVALTGWGQAQDRQAALDAGFDRHLTKPVAPEQLDELFTLKKGA